MLPSLLASLLALVIGSLSSAAVSPADLVSAQHGLYILKGKALPDPTKAYLSKKVSRLCRCKILCAVDTKCQAFSVIQTGSELLDCLLFDDNPLTLTPEENAGGYYGAKLGSDKTLANDGFLYMELEGGEKTWSRGVEGCAEKEGYRLGIYKTEDQKKVLEEYHAKVTRSSHSCVNVYLSENTSGNYEWGDQTLYKDYPTSETFYMLDNSASQTIFQYSASSSTNNDYGMQDRPSTHTCYSLCQADPFNFMLP